jgi:ABC-type transport system involved in multi-copper enzyme maturation permease subunit
MIRRLQDTLPLQTILVSVALVSVFLLVQNQVEAETLNFILDTTFTRPPLRILAICLSGIAFWGVINVLRQYATHHRWIVWRVPFKHLNWRALVGAYSLLLLLMIKPEWVGFPIGDDSLIMLQAVIPLVIALQTAAIFAPDDEPALEIQLAAPRPLSWLICERLVVVFLIYGLLTSIIGLGAIILQHQHTNILVVTLRWLPPALFLAGFGLLMTMQTRLVAFGIIFMGFVWTLFGLFGDMLLQGGAYPFPLNAIQPFLWVFNIFATPETFALESDFWLNRVMLCSTGIVLMMVGVWQVRDEESVLLNLSQRQRRKQVQTIDAEPTKSMMGVTSRPVDVQVNPLNQIWGMAVYEFRMHWRRRALKVFTLTLLLINAVTVFIIAESFSSATLPIEASELLTQTGLIANGVLLVMLTVGPLTTIAIYMFPIMVAEVVPLDKQYHMDEKLNALPLHHATYLFGKILGMVLAGLVAFGGATLFLVIGWYWQAGAFYPSYFALAIGVAFFLMLANSTLAILLGATQPTRLRAIVVVIIVAIGAFIVGGTFDHALVNHLLPNQVSFVTVMIATAVDALTLSPPQMPQMTIFDEPIHTQPVSSVCPERYLLVKRSCFILFCRTTLI